MNYGASAAADLRGNLMVPMYDRNLNLSLWWDIDQGHVFDHNMNWIAFVVGGNIFSAKTGNWLGKHTGATFQDKYGRAVIWTPNLGYPESGFPPLRPLRPLKPLRPLRPLRPLMPLRPMRPLAPLGGWSYNHFTAWLAG